MDIKRLFILGALSATITSISLYIALKESKPVANTKDIAVVEASPFGGFFKLKRAHPDSKSKEAYFSLKNAAGKFVILYFGYTYCPDVCPLGLSNISQALKSLGRDRDQFVPIFVTIDPERDTTETLALYASNFDPSFVFLTGSVDEIKTVKQQYRVYAEKENTKSGNRPENYLVNHSSYIYILGPDGQFIRNVPHDMPAHEMAKIFVGLQAQQYKK